ncbi:NADH dehydrogenase [ubiquinone] 1 beta subcomplex subunit 9 [Habropoda laboriosa]|uniref:NADH dehydrogenase [ubiquinone] 1 beta subcomplex subunit 9 n=1 Tax=Habropoda laboriosa TaxID=597456 RepID=A0A0L7R737_9HYME|nr:PREDICTED: NADH dehydrogenase [ubiquinone] 1 beta subcomplex subunit 9 [Habropoda laboriosa]KOC66697.1 NADH dehydrogenase [ubiquinone] 1 beta subcomplex subunit 9 [Habropoda laboriosa]
MAEIPLGLVSHARKVCSLYKQSLRNLENYYRLRHEYRYQAVLLRQRFEENRNILDARVAKQLLLDGQEELFQKLHAQPRQFPGSPGGICYERYAEAPDSVLDFWDPIEKAQYPKFFAKREELKKEYEKLYNKLYPEPSKETPKTT